MLQVQMEELDTAGESGSGCFETITKHQFNIGAMKDKSSFASVHQLRTETEPTILPSLPRTGSWR